MKQGCGRRRKRKKRNSQPSPENRVLLDSFSTPFDITSRPVFRFWCQIGGHRWQKKNITMSLTMTLLCGGTLRFLWRYFLLLRPNMFFVGIRNQEVVDSTPMDGIHGSALKSSDLVSCLSFTITALCSKPEEQTASSR
jgi:hypothetical protein